MSGPEALIPLVTAVCLFATIFGIVYTRNKENMALIERGINPRNQRNTPRPFVSLKYGLLILGAGIGLLAAFLIDGIVSHKKMLPDGSVYYDDNPAIYFSLIAIGAGLGLVISYMVEKKEWLDKKTKED